MRLVENLIIKASSPLTVRVLLLFVSTVMFWMCFEYIDAGTVPVKGGTSVSKEDFPITYLYKVVLTGVLGVYFAIAAFFLVRKN